jgi:hypothetical protein
VDIAAFGAVSAKVRALRPEPRQNNKFERNGDSKKSHFALASIYGRYRVESVAPIVNSLV